MMRRDYATGDDITIGANWSQHMNDVMCGDKVDDFYVFPYAFRSTQEDTVRERRNSKANMV